MRKSIVLILALVLTLTVFILPTYARKPVPGPQDVNVVSPIPVPVEGTVEVVNTVSVTGDVAVTNTPVPVTFDQPVSVTVTNTCEKTVISAYGFLQCPVANPTINIMHVDADKIFVLTDIVAMGPYDGDFVFEVPGRVYVEFNSNHPTRSVHFNSGIPFDSDSDVVINCLGNTDGHVTISGYTIDAAPPPSP